MTKTPASHAPLALSFRLDGRLVTWTGDPHRHLLEVLREDLHITSPKNGCAPQAGCGACTVLVNGKAQLSCAMEMARVVDHDVTTLAGLDPFEREALALAFAGHGGVQCGVCTPGILMRAHALLAAHPDPTDAEIRHALDLHLCRCTGWTKIVTSIQAAAVALRTRTLPHVTKSDGHLGARLTKVGARELALGEKPYVADLTRPGMLHGALRLAGTPRARVGAIDPTPALAMPGVVAVLTARDVPGTLFHGLLHPDWPLFVPVGGEVNYLGDVLAAVVATAPDLARSAAAAIRTDLEALPAVTDIDHALAPDAPVVHPGGNILGTTRFRKGLGARALASCAHVVRGTWTTQRIEHGFMAPECALAEPTADGVRVFSDGQGIYEDRRQIAAILGLREEQVEVVLLPSGGAFGGKEDLTVQPHAALAAFLTGHPVRFELTRAESICLHPKRHPMRLTLALGATRDGRLHALECRILGDNGCYASVGAKVLERAAGHASGAYDIPHCDIEAIAVATNNPPSGAMRGFGANQATFALECAIDELCEIGKFDRWQFRWDNALTAGRATATGQILTEGVGVRACLEAVRDRFQSARYAGLACAMKNTGIGNGVADIGRALLKIIPGPRIEIHHGWTEMGQGVDTVAIQMLCETADVDPELVTVIVETRSDVPTGMTTASRGTSLVGHGVRAAAEKLRADLATHALAELVGREYRGEWVCDWTTKPGDSATPRTHYSYSYAAQVAIVDERGHVSEVVAAHDVGRIVNPTLFEGQIEGSVHMGLGQALSEDLVFDHGVPVSTKIRDLGILRAHEMPKVTVIGVEVPDPHGPYGAKGVGEIGLIPTAPAVANAFWQFDHHRRYDLPLARKRHHKEQVVVDLSHTPHDGGHP